MNYLITGASRGIGFDTAMALAATAEDRIFVLSRNSDRLQSLADKAEKEYGYQNIDMLAADLSTLTAETLMEWIKPWGQLHGIVNNAGILIKKPFDELSPEDWEQTFSTNFFSIVRLLQNLHPLMDKTHIINIGSMGGFQGSSKFPGLVAYSTSKAALANLTECLAEEWKEEGIKCNCLALGAVQTEMLETAFPGFVAPVDSKQMGDMVAWFLRQGQVFFNGKVLPVSVSTP